MHHRIIILVSIVALSALGCRKPIAQQQEEMLIGSVYDYDEKKVKEIQLVLMYNGFDPESVDGAIGPRTREAIREFQESVDLPVSGYVSNETWAEMQRRGQGKPTADEDIQSALRMAGFDPLMASWVTRPGTRLQNFKPKID